MAFIALLRGSRDGTVGVAGKHRDGVHLYLGCEHGWANKLLIRSGDGTAWITGKVYN